MEKPPYYIRRNKNAKYNGSLSTIKDAARAIKVLLSVGFNSATVSEVVEGTINLKLWGVSEANGKYIGVQHWSVAALKQWHTNKNSMGARKEHSNLRHGFVHRRKQLFSRIVGCKEDVDTIAKDIFACIVTAEELTKLTNKAKEEQGWARHCALKIDVQKYDSDKQDWVDFIKDGVMK